MQLIALRALQIFPVGRPWRGHGSSPGPVLRVLLPSLRAASTMHTGCCTALKNARRHFRLVALR